MTAFVFEGVDRVGKTTALAQLKKLTGLSVMRVRRPAENGWEATKEWSQGKKDAEEIVEYARKKHGELDFLMDRFSYAELVYCKVFDRPCDFSWYRNILRNNKDIVKLVYVHDEPSMIAERWDKENMPTENIIPIMAEYTSMIVALGLVEGQDYIKFVPTQDKLENIVDWIKKHGKNSIRSSD